MRIPGLGCPDRKTLVILGAGATRGASFTDDMAIPPPLDLDFFRVLQMSMTGRGPRARDLLDHVRGAYGASLQISMETVFNNLAAAKRLHEKLKVDPGPTVRQPAKLIDAFNEVLPRLLFETVGPDCEYHAALAERLRVDDAVISLNYDCVMDRALWAYAGARFSPERLGYGVEAGEGAAEWSGRARGPQPRGSVQLLKLHGSVNWAAPSHPLKLRPPAELGDPVVTGVIQPPLTDKPVGKEPFQSIWQQARKAVRGMRRLIIIGYSMPDADGLVRAVLSTDLPTHLEEVIVADPSTAIQTRHTELFTRRAPHARVFAFSSFRDLAAVLRRT